MFARNAIKLINELELSDEIRPFNDTVFRQVLDEIDALFNATTDDVASTDYTDLNSGAARILTTIHIRHAAINRNKRCLLAYLYHRMQRLRDMRWDIGAILPQEVSTNLIPTECEWITSYNRSLAKYMKSLGPSGFDLTKDMVPPKSLYIEVRCLCDYGKLEIDNGQSIMLTKNTHHLLPRNQCESLIRQGILEHVDSW